MLLRYRSTLPPDWTWVRVRSGDWRTILQGLNRREQSPAFTVLCKRQTFLKRGVVSKRRAFQRSTAERFRLCHSIWYWITGKLMNLAALIAWKRASPKPLSRPSSLQGRAPCSVISRQSKT